MFLAGGQSGGNLDCSDSTSNDVDDEVKQQLATAYEDAKITLTDHRDQLERVAQELLTKETLDAKTFNALIGP